MTLTKQSLSAALQNPIIDNNFSPLFVRFLNDLVSDRQITTGTAQPVTLSSGAFSLIKGFSYYSVSVETGATDDLDTINNGNEGDLLFLKAADAAKTIVLKDGTGNILTNGSVDLSLDNSQDLAILHFDGTNWKADLWNIGA